MTPLSREGVTCAVALARALGWFGSASKADPERVHGWACTTTTRGPMSWFAPGRRFLNDTVRARMRPSTKGRFERTVIDLFDGAGASTGQLVISADADRALMVLAAAGDGTLRVVAPWAEPEG